MTNKYLEKIASTYVCKNVYIEKIASSLDWARSAAGGLSSIAKQVGRTADTAFAGGAYKRYAQSKGISNPAVLAKIDGSNAGRKNLSDAIKKTTSFKRDLRAVPEGKDVRTHRKEVVKKHIAPLYGKNSDVSKLRDETRRAKLGVGVTAGVAAYGAHKAKQNSETRYNSYRY